MILRLILLCAFLAALAIPSRAERAENAQAVLRSTSFAAGSVMESAAATQAATLGDLSSTGESATAIATIYGGFLIPALDSGGLITAVRIVNYLLSRDLALDPLAADFFGNGDGKLDVADIVTKINRRP